MVYGTIIYGTHGRPQGGGARGGTCPHSGNLKIWDPTQGEFNS